MYELMREWELHHYYHDVIVVKPTPFHKAGMGVYVREGKNIPEGFILPFWGVAGHLYNRCIAHIDRGRQVQIENGDKEPIRFFTHPACVAGFVNSTGGCFSNIANCILYFNYEYPSFDRRLSTHYFIHPDSFLFIKTTKAIIGDGTEDSQLLFEYESLRKRQVREKRVTE
jgi:hypothetical protein